MKIGPAVLEIFAKNMSIFAKNRDFRCIFSLVFLKCRWKYMHGTPHVSISKPFHPTITILKMPVKLAEVRGGRRMEEGVCKSSAS